jgi:riboflavin kinase
MLELLLMGAKDKPVKLSSKELAQRLGKSQQAASRNLVDLEREGLVERTRQGNETYLKLTGKGLCELSVLYASLTEVFQGLKSPTLELRGEVFSGMGEAAYYVSLSGYRRQFIRKLGFDPYPGTLNVKLKSKADVQKRRELDNYDGITIEGFDDGRRTFGGAKCFPAVINGKLEGDIIILERNNYDESVAEVIAAANIRKAIGLEDGDEVSIVVSLRVTKKNMNMKKVQPRN